MELAIMEDENWEERLDRAIQLSRDRSKTTPEVRALMLSGLEGRQSVTDAALTNLVQGLGI